MDQASDRHSDVLIIGGGVIGLACAYYLARDGQTVRILEKGRMGSGASHGNCGLLFFSDLPPLCAPGAIRQELVKTLKGTSSLYVKPRPDPLLAVWLLRFAAHCTASHRTQAIKARESLLGLSEALFDDLWRDETLACDHDRAGILLAFTDPAALAGYAHTNRLLEPFDLAATYLGADAAHALEPALSHRVCGGWHHRLDSHLRPESLMAAWSDAIAQKGVMMVENCPMSSFDIRGTTIAAVRTPHGRFTADRFVLAAGVWSSDVLHQLNVRIPVVPGKGYSITMDRPAVCPRIPCYLYERNVVVTPWASGYRLGGTMEFSGYNDRLDARRLDNLAQSAARYLRTPMGRRVVERWTGLRPMCVDDLPIIDRAPGTANLLIATGHGMLGLTTATGTGRLIADMVMERPPGIDPTPFSIRRFCC